jgi:hypothetical protein
MPLLGSLSKKAENMRVERALGVFSCCARRFTRTGFWLGSVAALAVMMAAQTPAKPEPDVLEFGDGERLVGHLVSGSGATLTFHSDAAGDIKVDWAKVKSLKSSGKFAVPEKGAVLDKHADPSQTPQGTVSLSDQKLSVDPGTGAAPTVIPVADAANVVPQASFLNAFKTPRFYQDWHGSAGFGVDLIEATQKNRNVTAGVSLQRVVSGESWIGPRYKTLFNLNFADGQLSQPNTPTITTDIVHANMEHDLFLSKKLFIDVSGDFLHSVSQGMKLQQTYGGGLGYVLLKGEHQELDVKASMVYVRQQFEQNGTSPLLASKSLVAAAAGETYTRNLRGGIAFHEGLLYTPSFNDTSAYTGNAYANFAIPIKKRISITLGGIESYINEPPVGFKKNSFEFVTQLAYKVN